MKQSVVVVLTFAIAALVAAAGVAFAEEPLPPHPHMLVLHLEFENGQPVGFGKCIDVAAGRSVPLHAHHDHIHTGRAGQALSSAGHAVIPGAPVTPWANCAELEEFFLQ